MLSDGVVGAAGVGLDFAAKSAVPPAETFRAA